MKNNLKYLICFLGLTLFKVAAQNPEIKSDLPTVIPPSPTVAALMKFEEVPVSNYTGVPDISIPLFNSPTLSKNVNLDISLKYHPNSAAADERASDVGLGWSLFAGGTISRTVRGLPDELLIYPGGGQSPASEVTGKIGIYQTSLPNHSNNYYYFTQNIANTTQDWYLPNLSQEAQNKGNDFLWNSAYTGKYDTEHDLWQFNFMGKSGRFVIKKNPSNGLLEVVPLDDYRVKIINSYSSSDYVPNGFTVFDENGIKYVFDIIENSRNYGSSSQIDVDGNSSGSVYSERLFNSSFHLSKIYDANNNLIIELQYNNTPFVEGFTNTTLTTIDYPHYIDSPDTVNPYYPTGCLDFPQKELISNSSTIVNVKKLLNINIIGFGKVSFDFLQGREDTNINNTASTSYLNSITLKNLNNEQIKKYSFIYEYSSTLYNRMFLKQINILGKQEPADSNYKFYYKENPTNEKIISKDYWGYLNLIDPCELNTSKHRNTSPEYSTTNILQKIKHPTGGSTLFNYEANQYSFIGNEEVTIFDENPDSYIKYDDALLYFNNSNAIKYLATSTVTRKLKFYPGIHQEENPNNNTRVFLLQKKTNGVWNTVSNLICTYLNQTCCVDFIIEANSEYRIKRENFDLSYTGTDLLTIEYYNITPKQFLYGGGNRIKNIGYFKNDVPKYYYDLPDNSYLEAPIKQKTYRYTLFNNTNKSSGSLVFPKPLFKYWVNFKTKTSLTIYSNNCASIFSTNLWFFEKNTSYNNLNVVKTQGADVGYKEVAVFETNNGKTEYTYKSPIDSPEEDIAYGPPFTPSKNMDYKRGLLEKEVVYDNQTKKLSESMYSYDILDFLEHTGTRFSKPYGACYTGSLPSIVKNYDSYLFTLSLGYDACIPCHESLNTVKNFVCPLPLDPDTTKPKILLHPIFEAYGWAKLASKVTKNYTYDNSNNQYTTQTTENFTYNPINKQIAEHTVTNSIGETLKTKYYYHTGNSIYSQNRIAEIEKIETYRGTNLMSTNKINYSNVWTGNVSYLPQSISTSKGTNTLESRVKYNKYDQYGNPLEVQQENGTLISYIWGYNQTQPVAKLENIAYGSIPASLIANIQSVSNLPTSTEAQVVAALNALRTSTDANLQKALITTYTYKPLVGVSTITDPKGDTMTYEYDAFGRLSTVKDKTGNKLSENEYHYRP